MVPNYVLPTNLVLEIVILSSHSYALGNRDKIEIEKWQKGIDETCAGIVSLFLVLNVLWVIYFRGKGREFTTKCLAARAFQGGIMIVLGVMLIVVAMSIRKSKICADTPCDRFETRLVIAILVLVDSVFYFLPPLRPMVTRQRMTTAVLQPSATGVYPIQGEHANHAYFIEPPPSYFQVQTNLGQGNNNISTTPPAYGLHVPPPPYGSIVSTNSSLTNNIVVPEYSVDSSYNHSDDNNNLPHLRGAPISITPSQNQVRAVI